MEASVNLQNSQFEEYVRAVRANEYAMLNKGKPVSIFKFPLKLTLLFSMQAEPHELQGFSARFLNALIFQLLPPMTVGEFERIMEIKKSNFHKNKFNKLVVAVDEFEHE